MTLNGIDIASHQAGIVPSATPSDFVIVKVTGGTWYVNPFWKDWADDVLASGKQLGLYHYAIESRNSPGATAEAEFFLSKIRGYDGKFIPVLDWEADALDYPVAFAKEWMDVVAKYTGADPMFYGYASNVNSTNYSDISNRPLWMASYLNRYDGAGFVKDPVQTWGLGDWSKLTMYQYTSTGYIPGYSGRLDLNVFYGDVPDWKRLCGKKVGQVPGKAKNDAGLKYHVHVQNLGDLETVHDGQVAGTVGESLRMEALVFDVIPEGWVLEARLHIQDRGWQTFPVYPGKVLGTTGLSKRIEKVILGVKSRPTGDKRKLYFQVHEQNTGWKAKTPEWCASGTDGMSRRLEAIRVWIA